MSTFVHTATAEIHDETHQNSVLVYVHTEPRTLCALPAEIEQHIFSHLLGQRWLISICGPLGKVSPVGPLMDSMPFDTSVM